MATQALKKVTALIRRDSDGSWLVSFPQVPGAHTYGRSLSQLRRRIPEVMRLWELDPERVEIVESIYLPPTLKAAVERAWASRDELNGHVIEVQRDLKAIIDRLEQKLRLGVRDTSELLGLSFQRVHQLRNERTGKPSIARRSAAKQRQLTMILTSTPVDDPGRPRTKTAPRSTKSIRRRSPRTRLDKGQNPS